MLPERFEKDVYSQAIIEKVERATGSLLSLGAIQLVKALEWGLKRGSGQVSKLAAAKARFEFHGDSMGCGYFIGDRPMDNGLEVSGRAYVGASYDFRTDEIIIGNTRQGASEWTPRQAVEAVYEAAQLQVYHPDPAFYDLFRPSVDFSMN